MGLYGSGSVSTSWLMDTTAPTSHVVNTLGTSQTSDTFPVTVSFTDPGSSPSGVSLVDLYVSVNNGPFTPSTRPKPWPLPTTSGTVIFSFAGQDRNTYAFHAVAHDSAGNTEVKSPTAIEASTSVPDLNPPVTHVVARLDLQSRRLHHRLDRNRPRPEQWHPHPARSSRSDVYVQIDGGTPVLIAQNPAGSPNVGGVYSGSLTYAARADGVAHTYGFFSLGIDDQAKKQATPSSPDVTFSNITYSAPLAVQQLSVEKGDRRPVVHSSTSTSISTRPYRQANHYKPWPAV